MTMPGESLIPYENNCAAGMVNSIGLRPNQRFSTISVERRGAGGTPIVWFHCELTHYRGL